MVVAGKTHVNAKVVCVNGKWNVTEIKQPLHGMLHVSNMSFNFEVILLFLRIAYIILWAVLVVCTLGIKLQFLGSKFNIG